MAISANTLGETASTLMDQINSGSITFESYQNSVNSIIQSATNNSDFEIEDNADAVHTVDLAIRLSKGEAPPVRRK